MKRRMMDWDEVARQAEILLDSPDSEAGKRLALIDGQRDALRSLCVRLRNNGAILADEVGMGKTRIAVALAQCVIAAGGRVVVVAPPGLDEQWRREFALAVPQPPALLRSYWQFLRGWDEHGGQGGWLQEPLLLLSHSFNRWSSSQDSSYRWSLLPETLARYSEERHGAKPRGHGPFSATQAKHQHFAWVCRAADAIVASLRRNGSGSSARTVLKNVAKDHDVWVRTTNGGTYSKQAAFRTNLDRVSGVGLGAFDLVIVDEAHKSRSEDSLLSSLLNNVLLRSRSARCLAMTATPVELDASQWKQSLQRIGVGSPPMDVINQYVASVQTLRRAPLNEGHEQAYLAAAEAYRSALDPYLLRRDKREDASVQSFLKHVGPAGQDYREIRPIKVVMDPATMSLPWMRAVCAAEALSFTSTRVSDSTAKRQRLTVGNGHGISGLIDAAKDNEPLNSEALSSELDDDNTRAKRSARADWWKKVLQNAVSQAAPEGGAAYTHPALLAAVEAIEAVAKHEKVLVFGHYRAPMHALEHLLNARAMLRALADGEPWAQSLVHANDRAAVQVAHRQLYQCEADLEAIDQKLQRGYRDLDNSRQRFRSSLLGELKKGVATLSPLLRARFAVPLKMLGDECAADDDASSSTGMLAVVARALDEHLGGNVEDVSARELADAFAELMHAAANLDPLNDDSDSETDEFSLGEKAWSATFEQLRDDYSHQHGTFARQMNGGTAAGSRRLLQLAFNRETANPRVLIAQSQVGREGLNLHLACRTVVLLHLEWNPAVVEQQIGRVDRMGSLWQQLLAKAIARREVAGEMPRIRVLPVVFQGTYDERQWAVLQSRWQTLRSQLHGEILPEYDSENLVGAALRERVTKAAPCFSPTRARRSRP